MFPNGFYVLKLSSTVPPPLPLVLLLPLTCIVDAHCVLTEDCISAMVLVHTHTFISEAHIHFDNDAHWEFLRC